MAEFVAQQRDAAAGQSWQSVQPGAGAEGREEQRLHLLVFLLLELQHEFRDQSEESLGTCRSAQ